MPSSVKGKPDSKSAAGRGGARRRKRSVVEHVRPAERGGGQESVAKRLDAQDPLKAYRSRFHIPKGKNGRPVVYLSGNSLGLQPKSVSRAVLQELKDWEKLGALAHFEGKTPWYSYHEVFREPAARLVGALPGEVVMMNGLTVNLHLMLVSFYRPGGDRFKVLMEDQAFPSDLYAVESHIRNHGLDPAEALVVAKPRPGENSVRTEDLLELIEKEGGRLALVFLSGVHYLTGQLFDMERIAAAAKKARAMVGFDLAHAAGNVPLRLHDWHVDFAVWCSYKYLNGGPGAVGGCFVHEIHSQKESLARFAGWWGNDPRNRFKMLPDFAPQAGAEGWQVSNPPILAMAPLRASLEIFGEAGMAALRTKSEKLTRYLLELLDGFSGAGIVMLTPTDPRARGCQVSLGLGSRGKEVHRKLEAQGIVCDFREPDVLRAAPVPLYNSFQDVWAYAQALKTAR